MSETDDRLIVERGNFGTIEFAVRSNGSVPAREFIEGFDEREQRRLAVLLHRMAEFGKITDPRKFKHVSGKIFEFKRGQVRLGCFQIGTRWLLTHGFVKKSDRWRKSQLERAFKIMDEHSEREKKKRTR